MLDFRNLLSNLDFDSVNDFVNEITSFLQDAFDWICNFVAYFQQVVEEWYPIIEAWLNEIDHLLSKTKECVAVITNPEFQDGAIISESIRETANSNIKEPLPENGHFAFVLDGEKVDKLASFGASQDHDENFRNLMEEYGGVIVLDEKM